VNGFGSYGAEAASLMRQSIVETTGDFAVNQPKGFLEEFNYPRPGLRAVVADVSACLSSAWKISRFSVFSKEKHI